MKESHNALASRLQADVFVYSMSSMPLLQLAGGTFFGGLVSLASYQLSIDCSVGIPHNGTIILGTFVDVFKSFCQVS